MNGDTSKKSILMIAGEASGDMHGANLMRAIKSIDPNISCFGIGGERLRAEGFESVVDAKEMSIVGFLEVVRRYPFLRRVLNKLKRLLHERKPDLVILIDYPGFNLRFAKAAKKRGVPVFYYISPQVWAWGKGRIRKIVKYVDRMVVIFPFEEPLFREAGVDVRFVGHPVKDAVHVEIPKDPFLTALGLDPNRPVVGILPGSREPELRALLPEMVGAFRLLQQRIPGIQAVLGAAETQTDEMITSLLGDAPIPWVRGRTYEVMAHADAAMVASGTATLETAILGTPMVILYKISPLSFRIAKRVVHLPHIGLVNIVAGREIAPELLQDEANARRIADEIYSYLTDKDRAAAARAALRDVSEQLGECGATQRVAEAVWEFLDEGPKH